MIKKSLFLIGVFSVILSGLLIPAIVSASPLDNACADYNAGICNKKDEQLDDLAVKVIEYLMYAVGTASIAFVVYGGILYATSSGMSDKITKAKKTILGAVIGLAVAILALAIVNFVKTTISSV